MFPVIKDKGLLPECTHLVNFLCMGCTSSSSGGPPLVAHKCVGSNVFIDNALQSHMHQFIMDNLPGLLPKPEVSSTPKMQALTDILGQMQVDCLVLEQQAEEQWEEANQPKTA